MKDYWFYLSHSRVDSSPYLKKFYADLSEELSQRLGSRDITIGFAGEFDLGLGVDWEQETVSALQSSRVFVPMLSPEYVTSEYCGREWQFFRTREQAFIDRIPVDTRYHSSMIPILWRPLKSALPTAVSDVQYKLDEFGEAYLSEGLLYLIKLKRDREYEAFLIRLAEKLYDIASARQLPPLENVPPLRELASAFEYSDTNRSNATAAVDGDRISGKASKEARTSEATKPVKSPAREKSKIFISYRRNDSEGFAGRLFDKLTSRFGEDQVFMDIDTIEPGEDFIDVIQKAVSSCDILIAIIGKEWLASTDTAGRRRLDTPEDFVRVEISTALERNIRVIPLLVQGAVMPQANELPDALNKLARRSALELSSARWKYDVGRLLEVIERVLGAQQSN